MLLTSSHSDLRHRYVCFSTYLPVVLTGDLNSTPDSSVVRFIATGRLKYDNLSEKTMTNTEGPKIGKKFLPQHLGITGKRVLEW